MTTADATDMDGLSQRLTPEQREWVRTLRDKNGIPCCDTADGYDVPWEGTADGHYRVLIDGEWVTVPNDALLNDRPNKLGFARVWISHQQGRVIVRCFLPGGGT